MFGLLLCGSMKPYQLHNQKQQNKESFTFEFYEKSPLKSNQGTFICNPLNGKHLRFIIQKEFDDGASNITARLTKELKSPALASFIFPNPVSPPLNDWQKSSQKLNITSQYQSCEE